MSRDDNRRIAEETVRIIEKGSYNADGRTVLIDKDRIREAELIEPKDIDLSVRPANGTKPTIRVTPKDTIASALSVKNPENTMVLNFASAMNPGSGFLSGASAQEEALCRASTLYASLSSREASELYKRNREAENPYYLELAVFSPYVEIIRNAYGRLSIAPRTTSVLTIAAVNRNRGGVVPSKADAIMLERTKKILAIAHEHGKRNLILGAWGCGVFGNSATDVARMFHEAINDHGALFDTIEFAILPGRIDNLTPFKKEFGV